MVQEAQKQTNRGKQLSTTHPIDRYIPYRGLRLIWEREVSAKKKKRRVFLKCIFKHLVKCYHQWDKKQPEYSVFTGPTLSWLIRRHHRNEKDNEDDIFIMQTKIIIIIISIICKFNRYFSLHKTSRSHGDQSDLTVYYLSVRVNVT